MNHRVKATQRTSEASDDVVGQHEKLIRKDERSEWQTDV